MKESARASSLSALRLHKFFSMREVVGGVDIDIRPGEVVGLLGPSGSGKSTIFNMIAGIVRPDAGNIVLDGRDVTDAGIDVRARLGIGYVPQAPALFPRLTVEQNLRIAIEASGAGDTDVAPFVAALCSAFSLQDVRRKRLASLSGGQRRRVEIAFAICGKPRFLLLDEPFAGLDPIVSSQLSAFVARLAAMGMGIVLTDHNVRYALPIVARAYVIDSGQIIASGTPDQVVASVAVRQRFLGEAFRI